MSGLISNTKTWLFVPGDRPERFEKAATSGAHVVVLDLEDAVAAEHKEPARAAVSDYLGAAAQGPALVVRVNSSSCPEGQADFEALRAHLAPRGPLLAVMTPKATMSDVRLAVERLGTAARLVALIESGLGVEQSFELASHPNVLRLAFGALDYAADVGAQLAPESIAFAESRIVNASAAAGVAKPLARPTVQLDDVKLLAKETAHARVMGFGGKLCVHPRQIAPVAAAFAPTRDEIDWAQRVIAESAHGAVRVGGEMIDAPQILRARNILEEASTP
ncbi:HpcH/HpaI aldolase [Segniliparus rotundus DSM 44985]|uniref:HpcH/HpaI aldolase n=1 Tax=Segniliparus rotundus (strain ATCC BAA-972 / CDC 1076 / CIP 108378 / DSM 44985 / JCM 13578) TaxID=640132 RepID=D6ZF46_SEGRD|nr:CoA ester lyase [Segniliparus rotundus]ADG97570.1 HpcH/HpaI aldolase [Segniliparus rotundus DSM 44985]